MAKRKSKMNTAALGGAAVALIMLVLVIVGICVDWMSVVNVPGSIIDDVFDTDIGDRIGYALTECEWEADALGAMTAFAYITIAASALTFLSATATVFAKKSILKFVTMILAAITVVSAVVVLICTYNYCGDTVLSALDAAPAIGAWLMTIGGVLCGLAGALTALKS